MHTVLQVYAGYYSCYCWLLLLSIECRGMLCIMRLFSLKGMPAWFHFHTSIQSKPRAYYILLTFCTILDAIGSTSKLCHMARDRREVPEQWDVGDSGQTSVAPCNMSLIQPKCHMLLAFPCLCARMCVVSFTWIKGHVEMKLSKETSITQDNNRKLTSPNEMPRDIVRVTLWDMRQNVTVEIYSY